MKPIMAPRACGIVPLALALVACAPMSREQVDGRADRETSPETEDASERSGSQDMQPMIEQIRADAAQRAAVALDDVKVLTVESVTWSDGSLGCPEPGMMYTQALVRGYRIRVDAAGTPMTYHTGATSTFVLCPPERAQEPSPVDPS
jgi:hypothetical protein